MSYSDGKTSVQMRDELLSWGVGRPIIRTAAHTGAQALRDLYNRVAERLASQNESGRY